MEGPRPPQLTEWNELVHFLDEQLRPQHDWSMAKEYPLALSPHNLHQIRIIKENGQILSHALIKVFLLKTPVGVLKVAAIGSVVTHPKFRNQGLSQSILDSCLNSAKEQGCELAILWTDLFDFYRKVGFELAGTEVSLVLESELPLAPTPHQILETNQVAPEALLRVYNQHQVGSVRSVSDIQKCLQIPGSRVYTAWDSAQQLGAYAIEGKGADLNGYIHEWGGAVSQLIPLFNHVRQKQQRPLTILAPVNSQNLIRQLQQFDVTYFEGYLGMLLPLNTQHLFFKAQRLARSFGIDHLILEEKGSGFLVGTTESQVTLSNIRELTQLLFGPLPVEQFQGLTPSTVEVLEKLFPFPLWIWGWDSV